MSYSDWKIKHLPAATPEQLARFEATQKAAKK
jgi:hypothetical protein